MSSGFFSNVPYLNTILQQLGVSKESRAQWYIGTALAALGVCAVAVGAFFVYRWYAIGRAQVAQNVFAQNVELYAQAEKQNVPQGWRDVAGLFSMSYQQHKRAALAPYTLGFEADAHARAGNREQAIASLDTMLQQLSSSSPLYGLFATKRALLSIDLGNESGVQDLQALALQQENSYRDYALYYLGLYYWTKGELEEAESIWRTLLDTDWGSVPSPWATRAQEKLQQIA